MKKFMSSFLSILLSFMLVIPVHSIVKAETAASSPAKLNVNYKLKSSLSALPQNVFSVYDKTKRIIMLDKSLENFKPNIGQIFIDKEKGTALKIQSYGTDGNGKKIIKTESPKMNEIFESFNIPLQTVKLTAGNVKIYKDSGVKFTSKPVAASSSILPASTKFLNEPAAGGESHRFDLTDLTLIDMGDRSNGTYILLKVNGYIEYQLPTFYAQGSLTDFQLSLSAYEKSVISAHLEGKINKDHDFLIAGYTIPFGIGQADVGIYLHYKINGDITVDVKVEQGVSFNAGITGKYDFPFSYDLGSHFNSDHYFNYSSSIQGKLSATAGVALKCGLEVFDINLASIRTEFGAKIEASINNTKVDLTVNAFLYSKAEVLEHDFSILDKQWKIYESHENYTAGYKISLTEVDAYSNRISGYAAENNNPNDPYTGKVLISIKRGTAIIKNYITDCNSEGKFSYYYPGLRPNDIVTAKINIANPKVSTGEIKATLSFDKIEIISADAFNDKIKGKVTGNYRGPVIIKVESTTIQPASKNNKKKVITTVKAYPVTCTNGEFQYSTPIKGSDKVYALLLFEGTTLTSQKVTPTLALDIYLIVDKDGLKGTIQNTGGTKSFTGKVTILSKPIPTGSLFNQGETNAVAYPPVVTINSSSWNNLVAIPGQSILPARYLSIGPFGSSHFEFNKLKLPANITNIPWSAYAKVEYEGASVQGKFTISTLTMAENLSSNLLRPKFDLDSFLDKGLIIKR